MEAETQHQQKKKKLKKPEETGEKKRNKGKEIIQEESPEPKTNPSLESNDKRRKKGRDIVEEEPIDADRDSQEMREKKRRKGKGVIMMGDAMEAEMKPREKKVTGKEKEKEVLTVTMELIKNDPNKIGPIIGYFPSGYDPLNRERHPIPPMVQLYRHKDRPKRLQLVVSPSEAPVRFVGTNYSGEAALPQYVNYGLGVLDRETKTLKIVPIAGGKIFRLDPKIKGLDKPREASGVKEELTPEKKWDQMRELTSRYGTKTAVRGSQKFAQLQQSKDVGLGLEVDEGLLDKKALASTSSEVSRMIPSHDMTAETPEKAYPLEKIILKGEWVYLMDIWESLEAKEEIKPDVYPTFVCNRVHKLDLIKDEPEKKRLAGILSYITHLIKFKDQYSVDGHSSSRSHRLPGILSEKFSAMFFDSEKRRLSGSKITLLTSYVLVLTMHFDEFKTDPSDIAKDLRTTILSLRKDFDNLGCKFARENNVSVATLPVPLKFRVALRKRKR
ncbi:hypothetical protein Dimus_004124 [Dionaea muscipula]